MNKVLSSIKNGTLIYIREIHLAKQSLQKLFDLLTDQKTVVHENFRIIFNCKNNEVLSNIIYDNCIILNRNLNSIDNMKDYVLEIFENSDIYFNDNLVNLKKHILLCRKIFFHLIIVHAVIKQYKFYNDSLYNIPYEFNKKDLYNCLYFVTNYLKNLDPKDIKDDAQNYFLLINIIFESNYANRLVYKEDFHRLMKLLLRFFEEDKFLHTDFYFYLSQNSQINIKVTDSELSPQEISKILRDIPMEAYYELLDNINPIILKDKLSLYPRAFYSYFDQIYSQKLFFDDNYTKKEDWNLHNFLARLKEIKVKIPQNISFSEDEVYHSYLKQNKQGDLAYPLDDSLRREIESYNNYLEYIREDIECMIKVHNGSLIYSEDFNQMIQSLINGLVPSKWLNSKISYFVESENLLVDFDIWLSELELRINKMKKWLLLGNLEVYNLNIFFNRKIFLINLINHFAKKFNFPPDTIKLKFSLEKSDNIEMIEKKQDSVYVNGLIIENVEYDAEKAIITNPKTTKPFKLPIMKITFIKIDEEDEDTNEDVICPIFDNESTLNYENIEPLGNVILSYESPKKEDYWTAKGVRITIDKELIY